MKRLFLTAMLITFAVALSSCGLIDFEDQSGTGNPQFGAITTIATDGSTWSVSSQHAHVILDPSLCLYGGCVAPKDGVVYLASERGSLGFPIIMRSASGAPFGLMGFDGNKDFNDDTAAANGGYPNATHIKITGTFSGGTQDTQFLPLASGGWTTFTLSWSNLVAVTFDGARGVNGPAGAFSIDNIQVSGGAAAAAESVLGERLGESPAGDPLAP